MEIYVYDINRTDRWDINAKNLLGTPKQLRRHEGLTIMVNFSTSVGNDTISEIKQRYNENIRNENRDRGRICVAYNNYVILSLFLLRIKYVSNFGHDALRHLRKDSIRKK